MPCIGMHACLPRSASAESPTPKPPTPFKLQGVRVEQCPPPVHTQHAVAQWRAMWLAGLQWHNACRAGHPTKAGSPFPFVPLDANEPLLEVGAGREGGVGTGGACPLLSFERPGLPWRIARQRLSAALPAACCCRRLPARPWSRCPPRPCARPPSRPRPTPDPFFSAAALHGAHVRHAGARDCRHGALPRHPAGTQGPGCAMHRHTGAVGRQWRHGWRAPHLPPANRSALSALCTCRAVRSCTRRRWSAASSATASGACPRPAAAGRCWRAAARWRCPSACAPPRRRQWRSSSPAVRCTGVVDMHACGLSRPARLRFARPALQQAQVALLSRSLHAAPLRGQPQPALHPTPSALQSGTRPTVQRPRSTRPTLLEPKASACQVRQLGELAVTLSLAALGLLAACPLCTLALPCPHHPLCILSPLTPPLLPPPPSSPTRRRPEPQVPPV